MAKNLSGLHRHWVYFIIVMGLTIAYFTIYGANMAWWRNAPDFRWRTMYETGPNMVTEAFDTGDEPGLQVGDVIVAINGKKYSSFDELYFEVRNRETGSKNTYLVMREGKQLELTITTHRYGFKEVIRRSGPLFVIGTLYFMIGVLVFLMKPQAKESLLFFVMISFLGAMICYSSPSELLRPLWLFDIRSWVEVFMPAPMIHLALVFPKRRRFIENRSWLAAVPYLASLALFIVIRMNSTAYWNIPPVLNLFWVIYIMTGVVLFLLLTLWNLLKDTSVLVRVQSQVILVGIILGFFIPTADLLARSYLGIYLFPDPVIGFMIFLTAFPLSIGYTIVKHDLFAIDTFIKRTYGYILTTGTVAGIYGLFVMLSNLAFGGLEFTKYPVFPLIFILAVIFFFNPLRNRMQKFIDRTLYRLEYDYQETVTKISETMRSLLNLDEIGKSIMQFALEPMFVDSGAVLLFNRDKKEYEYLIQAGERELKKTEAETMGTDMQERQKESRLPERAGKENPAISKLQLPDDEPLIQKIAEKQKEVTVYDIEKDPLFVTEKDSCKKVFERLGATLIVPLIYENRLTGMISLGRKKSGKFYRREDVNLLNILANQGAVAIENARMVEEVIEKERMEEELSIARDLQVSMLPAVCPQIAGFEIAAYSLSAREVGGDFYDFIDMGEKKAGMLIGDVTGKSVSGALVMSASRSVFRMLSEEELSVSESMMRANRRLKKDVKSGMFVALLYAVLNSQDRTLTLCSAGQTQPVLMSAKTAEATLVATEGDTFPLGILEDANYEETSLQLQPGDKLVFYTDGIVEAMNAQHEIYGFERLLEEIKSSHADTAEELMKEIISSVHDYTGDAPQHDDITVIVVNVGQ